MDKYLIFLVIGSALFFACQNNVPVTKSEKTITEVAETVVEKSGLKLSTDHRATMFENASLNLIAPDTNILDTGTHKFRFEVLNYNLSAPTLDVLSGQCANSKKGQHIHFIMNNAPYTAYYEAEFEQKIRKGHNVLLAFLSRSYHMSVKNKNAFVLKEFTNGNVEDNFDENEPHIFYSSPKGEYVGNDANKVMLDFYLLNTDLQDKNYSVTATINGISFEITMWEPYFIEGLKNGNNTIKLELKDENGNLLDSPFNPVERTISIKYDEENI